MSSTTSDQVLPAFGIRDLNGPEEEAAVIHITGSQYDATVGSQAEAALTYLDDDDGELITVGSAFELEQRLDEPVPRRSRRRVQATSISRTTSVEQLMHIFDIKHTNAVVAEWKQYEAYSNKNGKQNPSTSTISSPMSSTSPGVENVFYTAAKSPVREATQHTSFSSEFPKANSNNPRSVTNSRQNPLLQDLDAVLKLACEGLESHLGGFGMFLDTTAEALQVAAQKTRETDTTPIEDLLTGMKNIMTEVGGLGLTLLRGFNPELVPTAGQSGNRKEESLPSTSSVSGNESNTDSSQTESQVRKRVSFADIREVSQSQVHDDSRDNVFTTTISSVGSTDLAQDCDSELWYSSSTVESGSQNLAHSTHDLASDSKSNSILDLETSDPDFSSRYPPLLSVRRAKTISDLHNAHSLGDHKSSTQPIRSALVRYPSVAQLEQKRGSLDNQTDYVRTSTSQNDRQLHGWRKPRITRPFQHGTEHRDGERNTVGELRKQTADNNPERFDSFAAHTASHIDLEKGDMGADVDKTVPGSWPEVKKDEASFHPPVKSESSGEFFNRMTAHCLEKRNLIPTYPVLSCRNTSPPREAYGPPQNLRRAHTVTASNPAARLTKPFDPMLPGPAPNSSTASTDKCPSLAHHHLARHNSVATPYCSTRSRDEDQLPSVRSVIPPTKTLWDNFPRASIQPSKENVSQTDKRNLAVSNMYDGSIFPRMRSDPTPPHAFAPFQPTDQTSIRYPRPLRPDPLFAYPAPTSTRNGRAGAYAPPPSSISKEDECIKQLKAMGYGLHDPNEASRLHVYAGAAAGDVGEAIEMIEDDREAAKNIKEHRDAVNKVVENREPNTINSQESGDGSRWRLRTEE